MCSISRKDCHPKIGLPEPANDSSAFARVVEGACEIVRDRRQHTTNEHVQARRGEGCTDGKGKVCGLVLHLESSIALARYMSGSDGGFGSVSTHGTTERRKKIVGCVSQGPPEHKQGDCGDQAKQLVGDDATYRRF